MKVSNCDLVLSVSQNDVELRLYGKTGGNMVKWIIAGGVMFGMAAYGIFSYKLHQHNQRYLREMGPNKAAFEDLFQQIERDTPYLVLVTSGYRSHEEQVRLKKQNSKNASPGRSPHQFHRAMDINLISVQGLIRKSDSKKRWNATGVPQIAKQKGFRWGGDFRNYHDPVHFEVSTRKK